MVTHEFNAPNYIEHQKEYFKQNLFFGKKDLYFLYMKIILCP